MCIKMTIKDWLDGYEAGKNVQQELSNWEIVKDLKELADVETRVSVWHSIIKKIMKWENRI